MKKLLTKIGGKKTKPNKSSLPLNIDKIVIKKVKAFTMLSQERLENLLRLSKKLVQDKVDGDFVECGTCRGGSAALLAFSAMREGWKRKVWLFDSFQGHPKPTHKSGIDKEIMKEWSGTMVASQEDVILALKTINSFSSSHVKIIPGWFDESLQKAKINSIALLHIDADWYDATKTCLDQLYPKVVQGGYLIIDDYKTIQFPGVKDATDLFSKTYTKSLKLIAEVGPAIVFQKV